MSTDPKSVNWHGENGQRFAFIDHAANSYTIREDNGYDVFEIYDNMIDTVYDAIENLQEVAA